jgi:putative intracellular protease/amidase
MSTSDFLRVARSTGVDIITEENVIIWQGTTAGNTKTKGPLVGKNIGVIVASEFSDFQAYYLASYIGEFGGKMDFLLVDWVKWKFTRPSVSTIGVRGMWGVGVDPIPSMPEKYCFKSLSEAQANDYDAIIIIGGHSGDVMMTESKIIDFIKEASDNGAVIGGVGGGILPLIKAGIVKGKKCTGNKVVSYMLKKISVYHDASVVRDGKLVTARDTIDMPAFVRTLCKTFDPDFVDWHKGVLVGKRILIIAGEDFEDIELTVPTVEFLYRGAKAIIATFPAPLKSRPPMVGLDVVMGSFGVSVPLQEIPESEYTLVKLAEVSVDDFDLVMIPGAFCPWNIVAAGETEWLKKAYASGKLVAAICHGAIPLAAADLLQRKKVAGWLACKDSVEIMGGTYNFDWSAVIDGRIITGRLPRDLPEFLDAMTVALLSK